MLKVLKFSTLLFSIIVILFYSGCSKDDDPVSSPGEHFEAIGVYLSTSGIKAASILRGITSDTLIVPADSIGDALDVQFYDEDEEIIAPPDDPDLMLSFEIGDTSIAGIYQHPGEEGGFEFHIQGKKAGVTYVELFIMHEGHSDFRSGKIPLKIVDNISVQ